MEGTNCALCPEEGWTPKESETKDMTTDYCTGHVILWKNHFHKCAAGGVSWGCGGGGGSKSVHTYVTATKEHYYTFSCEFVSTGTVTFEFLDSTRATIKAGGGKEGWRKSFDGSIKLEKDDRLKITLDYSINDGVKGSLFKGKFTMKPGYHLITHRTNPGSSYCGY
jgi:hypothetical protein